MTLQTLILLACGVCAIILLGRILFLFGWRQPRLARVVSSDYNDGVRQADRDFHLAALVDGIPTADDLHYRNAVVRVVYDVNGVEFRSDVMVTVHKGDTIDPNPIVWIDPANPQHATARGPGYWTMWLLLDAFVALLAWLLLR